MAGCRDCKECTEPVLFKLVAIAWRLPVALLTFWNVGLFRRYCPHCHHRLAFHQRVGGRFAD